MRTNGICAWITTKSTYESFEPESYIQGVYYGLNNIAVDKQMTMSDYVKSIAKQGTQSGAIMTAI